MAYRNRFITETDEVVKNDCTVCSALMTVGYGTLDRIFVEPSGTIMTDAEVKALRERIRKATGDTAGGTSIEDCIDGLEAVYPWFEGKCEHLVMSSIEGRWKAGYSGTVQGNPSAVTNRNSPLRRWTVNDDYGHAIKGGPMRSDNLAVWVQDPMGHGDYEGQWVLLTEMRQFMRAMRRLDGTYHTFLVKEGALLSTVTVETRTSPARSFTVAKGIRKIGYVLSASTGKYTLKVDKTQATTLTGTGHVVDIDQYPAAQKPSGAAIRVVTASDPAYVGTTMALSNVTLGAAPVGAEQSYVKGWNEALGAGKVELDSIRK